MLTTHHAVSVCSWFLEWFEQVGQEHGSIVLETGFVMAWDAPDADVVTVISAFQNHLVIS